MNKQEVLNKLQRNLYPKTSISSWDEGYNTGVTLAIRTITELDSLEQILVPQYVADWIEWCKRNKVFLLGGFSAIDELGFAICNDKKVKSSKASKWATRNQETFAKAWMYGYEVEKEKLYTVEIPNPIGDGYTKVYLGRNEDNKVGLCIWGCCSSIEFSDNWKQLDSAQLTENEIKENFDWAWQFAKEVEDD